MARNRVDTCMFCQQAPCACNAKPAAPKKPQKPKPLSDVERMKARAAQRRTGSTAKPRPAVSSRPTVEPDTLQLARAVAVLDDAGMLAPYQRYEHRALLQVARRYNDEIRERAAQWRISRAK